MNSEITLKSLIDEAFEIKSNLEFCKGDFWGYYKIKDNLQYEEWQSNAQRLLLANFPNDPYERKFEEASLNFRKYGCDPEGMDKLIAILKACEAIPLEIAEKHKSSGGINVNINQTNNQT